MRKSLIVGLAVVGALALLFLLIGAGQGEQEEVTNAVLLQKLNQVESNLLTSLAAANHTIRDLKRDIKDLKREIERLQDRVEDLESVCDD